MSLQHRGKDIFLSVENIGGIEDTSVSFPRGTVILSGRNATNRTSLLQAIMAALGSEQVSIKGDADRGSVELSFGDETYTRTLYRENGTVHADGEPFCATPEVADLYAFLLPSNEVRQRVTSGGDLRELIMKPIDTEEIQAEINCRVEQRRALSDEIDTITEQKGKLPELEQRRETLRKRIDNKRDELQELEAAISSHEASVDQTKAEQSELESTLATLRSRRSELEQLRYEIKTTEETIAELRSERTTCQAQLADIETPDPEERSRIDNQLEQLREQQQQLTADITDLQTIIEFNEEMLAETDGVPALDEQSDGALTDDLLPGGTVTCWTCGSSVSVDRIESTIESLRETTRERVADKRELEADIETLQEQRKSIDNRRQRHESLTQELDRIEAELDDRTDVLAQQKDRRDQLIAEIETLEADVEALESNAHEELLELHRDANQLEHEIGRLEAKLDTVTEEITDIESQLDRLDELETERERLSEEITDLRTKIEDIEQEAITQFNTHMDAVLEALDYENLDRIWLERQTKEVTRGRRTVTEDVFQLHIIRRSDSGRAYEDTIDHLSESEREVTGLVFALAGYLAHDVDETCPVVLLDSLEAIDSQRIAQLIEYISDHVDLLVAALLPEDAAAVDSAYPRITDI